MSAVSSRLLCATSRAIFASNPSQQASCAAVTSEFDAFAAGQTRAAKAMRRAATERGAHRWYGFQAVHPARGDLADGYTGTLNLIGSQREVEQCPVPQIAPPAGVPVDGSGNPLFLPQTARIFGCESLPCSSDS